MLSDLFQRLRQNEPKKILYLRRFIIIISLALLVTILVILCMEVYYEVPSLKTTPKQVDSLSVPGKDNFIK